MVQEQIDKILNRLNKLKFAQKHVISVAKFYTIKVIGTYHMKIIDEPRIKLSTSVDSESYEDTTSPITDQLSCGENPYA